MQTAARTHDIAMRATATVAVMALTTVTLMAWVMATQPSIIVSVMSGDDARAIAFVVFDVLHKALSAFLQNLL
jgi:hypothetical protein